MGKGKGQVPCLLRPFLEEVEGLCITRGEWGRYEAPRAVGEFHLQPQPPALGAAVLVAGVWSAPLARRAEGGRGGRGEGQRGGAQMRGKGRAFGPPRTCCTASL